MNDQLEKVIAACLDDLSRCKPAQTESILRQHFAPVVAAVERDRDEYQEMEQVADSFRQQWKLESESWKRKAEEAQTDKLLICDWMKRERAAEIRGLRRALNFANESYKDKRHEQLFLTEQAWEEATEKVINFCEDEIKKLEAK